MQDQSPALLESNLLANSKIMPEMRKKARKHRKPRKKLQLVQCGSPGVTMFLKSTAAITRIAAQDYACTLSMGMPVICESVDGEDEG
ncbi:hypothetical protein E4U56_006150 [Claviceps arundinis]|uniref:Uncharacterized protein n=1 Tax=Claviceps arundinis TaxID=1623583 RepID=A0A9P7SSM9_9HYPO|nr:hypothetical protein E4U56_006150 [Claviceps arundinis]